jgi:LmbE family N-acetylglucosaminyl deacetylase
MGVHENSDSGIASRYKSNRPTKILALSPHADDIEYGAGCLLDAYISRGHSVTIVLLAGSNSYRTSEAALAAQHLGASLEFDTTGSDGKLEASSDRISWLDKLIADGDVVLAPHPDDSHQDHRATAYLANAACRRNPVCLAWYRTPSTGPEFRPNLFHPITEWQAERRATAISCHISQRRKVYLSQSHLEAKDAWHGWLAGLPAAEPFQVVRQITQVASPLSEPVLFALQDEPARGSRYE